MSLRHAILGFLSLCPLSGYELRKHMDESTGHFWSADQAQIYRTLAQLVTDGCVDVRDIPQSGKPDRREHSITAAGLRELDAWLASPIGYAPAREAFLVRLFFIGRLGLDATLSILDARAAEASNVVRELAALRDEVSRELPKHIDLAQQLRLATLDNGLRHARAELDWATDLSTALRSGRVES